MRMFTTISHINYSRNFFFQNIYLYLNNKGPMNYWRLGNIQSIIRRIMRRTQAELEIKTQIVNLH